MPESGSWVGPRPLIIIHTVMLIDEHQHRGPLPLSQALGVSSAFRPFLLPIPRVDPMFLLLSQCEYCDLTVDTNGAAAAVSP